MTSGKWPSSQGRQIFVEILSSKGGRVSKVPTRASVDSGGTHNPKHSFMFNYREAPQTKHLLLHVAPTLNSFSIS